jgi:hypothetical protein
LFFRVLLLRLFTCKKTAGSSLVLLTRGSSSFLRLSSVFCRARVVVCTEKKEAAMAKDVAARIKERLRLRRRRSCSSGRVDGQAEEAEEEEEEEETEANVAAEESCQKSEQDDGDDGANGGEREGNGCMDPSRNGACGMQTHQASTCGGPWDHQNPEANTLKSSKKKKRFKKRKSGLEIDRISTAAEPEDAAGEHICSGSNKELKDSQLIFQGIATKKPSKFVRSKLQFSDLAFLLFFFLEVVVRLRTVIHVQKLLVHHCMKCYEELNQNRATNFPASDGVLQLPLNLDGCIIS